MAETNLGWHQVDCSRCVEQQQRTTCHQMKSVCAVCGASHCQLISFLDVVRTGRWVAIRYYSLHPLIATTMANGYWCKALTGQVDCSRCVDQQQRTTCHQMKSACAVRGASHCQLISFLDVVRTGSWGCHKVLQPAPTNSNYHG